MKKLYLFALCCSWVACGHESLQVHDPAVVDEGDDRNDFFLMPPARAPLIARARLPKIRPAGARGGDLIAVTPEHAVVGSRDGGASWVQLMDPGRSHRPVTSLLPGSSEGMLCVRAVMDDKKHWTTYCRPSPSSSWRRVDHGENGDHWGFGSIMVSRSAEQDTWLYGVAMSRTISGSKVNAVGATATRWRLGSSSDLGVTWQLHPMGWQPFVQILPAAPGILAMSVADERDDPSHLYCRGSSCEAVEAVRQGLSAFQPQPFGRALYITAPAPSCTFYAQLGAPPRRLGVECEEVSLLAGRDDGNAAVWTRDGQIVVYDEGSGPRDGGTLPAPGCELMVTPAGLMTCVDATTLWTSADLGETWAATCRAGTCALFDATAAAG